MSVPDLSRQKRPARQLLGKGSCCLPWAEDFSEGPRWQEGCSGMLGG